MKANFLCFILLSACFNLFSQDCQHKKNRKPFVRSFADASRSDSLDVLHVDLNIDMTHWSDQELFGAATIDLESKLDNVQNIVFDLLALQVDSVKLDGSLVNFSTSLIQLHLLCTCCLQHWRVFSGHHLLSWRTFRGRIRLGWLLLAK